jgi:hypothetical protein
LIPVIILMPFEGSFAKEFYFASEFSISILSNMSILPLRRRFGRRFGLRV